MVNIKKLLLAAGTLLVLFGLFATSAFAGSIFLTGHDPDFHASMTPSNTLGAQHLNQAGISFIMDPLFNPFATGAATKFLFVEGMFDPPIGHRRGVDGIVASGFGLGSDFEHHDATTLDAQLDLLGTVYGGLVIASDFGGRLSQAELDILNARSANIIGFLNAGGGLYAMSESNHGAGLTPGGGHYGYLPFVVSSVPANQAEQGVMLTTFGESLGLVTSDVNGNFSHNIFDEDSLAFGMQVVDFDSLERILTIAGRTSFIPTPEPGTLLLLATGALALGLGRRRGMP